MTESQTLTNEASTPEEINDLIIDSIQDIKGLDIVKLDLRKLDESPTDFFIVCSGESSTQIKAIANNVCKRLKYEANVKSNHVEGLKGGKWVLVDLFTVIVHIFYPETRAFYEIEDLWSDAVVSEYQNI